MSTGRTQPKLHQRDHDGPSRAYKRRYTITNIIPPRPGSNVGTLVFDEAENPPAESVTVRRDWLRATHARIGGRISFVEGGWLRYHWEELDANIRRVGIMDELYPRKKNGSA